MTSKRQDGLFKALGAGRRSQRFLLLVVAGLVVAAGAICTLSLIRKGDSSASQAKPLATQAPAGAVTSVQSSPVERKLVSEQSAFTGSSLFERFAPQTEAERELERMLRGKDEAIDLALANRLIVADVPQFRDLTREAYLAQLEAMTDQVRQEMARMRKVATSRGESLEDPKTRCAIFCNAIIKLRFAYAEEFRQETITPSLMKALYSDAGDISGFAEDELGHAIAHIPERHFA